MIGMAAQAPAALGSLLQTYSKVFGDGLGTLKQFEAKTQPVPFSLKDVIGAELNRLERGGGAEES